MKRNGSKMIKALGIALLYAALLLALIVPSAPVVGTVYTVHASTPQTANLTSIQGINSTMFAYIYGVPTSNNPFSGYSIPNVSSAMPPNMFIVIHSYGNSTVQITWSGVKSGISDSFAWSTKIPFTPGLGIILVEITIYSLQLKQSVTIQYTINIMSYTQYINYENRHNPVSSNVQYPWYIQYEQAEAVTAFVSAMVTIFYFYSQIQWENKEKKQKLFDIV